MGTLFVILAAVSLIFSVYWLNHVLFLHAVQTSLPLLHSDPVSFTQRWEKRYGKLRIKTMKNTAMFLLSLGFFAQGQTENAMDRMRFVSLQDLFLERDLAAAHYHRLLVSLGEDAKARRFWEEEGTAIERGRLSPWY